ncbi:MAG: T9SS type A sorting domain-containing protein [Ignavibacteria bacterium]|nr:T9SS type A sorting domain-containing protein [Ignavibacteria bacterium]
MKKTSYSRAAKLSFIMAFVCLVVLIYGFRSGEEQTVPQTNALNTTEKMKPLAAKINSIKASGKSFSAKEIFTISSNRGISTLLSGYLRNSTSLLLNEESRDRLLSSRDENILFNIPTSEGKVMALELTRVNITTDDFKAGTLSGNGTVNYISYTPGLYYRGIIKGDNRSFASLSIFNDFVMAVISNKEGNWNLSSIKGTTSMYSENYVFYNDADLVKQQDFICGVDDESDMFDKRSYSWSHNTGSNNMSENAPPQLVRKYFECDYKMYQDYGNNAAAVNNYVTAFFNSCATMYAQDSINTAIQQIFVWTTPDVYAAVPSNLRILKMFGARLQNSINGDLAHWVSTRTDISGGVAWLGVLCTPFNAPDSSGAYGVSVIDTQLVPFPQYSWVVNVVVHEMGHNLGSNHTHNCDWPGGPIDSCFATEGGCYTGPLIPRVGTVMSYCHLNATVNLALGFGPMPGDTIRANVRRANCLTIGVTPIGTEIPASYMLEQNYPNPFNPVTNIKFSVPKSGLVKIVVFDVSGKEIAALVNENLSAGTYNADFDASQLASGVYFYKLESGDFVQTKKMVLVK